jgi:hypothetical protein
MPSYSNGKVQLNVILMALENSFGWRKDCSLEGPGVL